MFPDLAQGLGAYCVEFVVRDSSQELLYQVQVYKDPFSYLLADFVKGLVKLLVVVLLVKVLDLPVILNSCFKGFPSVALSS